MGFKIWRRIPGKGLRIVLQVFSAVALIFEGYNQGVMGTVSGTPGFIDMAKIGANGIVTDSTKQGGLAAAYYFGAMWGCFIGGWAGDKFGRKKGVMIGATFCLLGGALMAASQNANMFICARIIAGIGIGFINAIVPPWVSELSEAHDRGANFSLVFTANFIGITIAYWLNYGVRHSSREFIWRFPLAFMVCPVLIIMASVAFMPDSPRWLMVNGRRSEAIEVLAKVRGDLSIDDPSLAAEIEQLEAIIEASHHKRNDIWNIAIGRYSGRLHLGRRAWMGFWLQQIQQWTGILAIATWAGTLFKMAGFDDEKAAWLSGLVNTTGILGTACAALVVDRLGRINSLMVSFVTQGIALFMVAAFMRTSELSEGARSAGFGIACSVMVFVFLFIFTMFNIVPCWIYSTEIWPQEIRAKGYSFTILGWAIGCGVTTFVIPIMLSRLGWASFLVFGCFNIIAMPIIWYIYPEVAGRTLEEVNLLFTADSLLASTNMKEYHRLLDEAGGNVAVADRRLLDSVNAEFADVDAGGRVAQAEEGKVVTHEEEKVM